MLADSFNRMAQDLVRRTDELFSAQEELVRKEKLAVLGQLSGSVGHELRNPLAVMANAVYFLKMILPDADPTATEYLGIIQDEIAASQRIIADLLDFDRTRTPQLEAIAVEELVRKSLERCSIPERITVSVGIEDASPKVQADPLQLCQVLRNLISNAVQAMQEGGSLTISGRAIRGGEVERMEIGVSDTGHGISADLMKKLFHPLFTTKAKGIGLGLVICKNLVEGNGGIIKVASEPGTGTTVTITLPVADGTART